MLAGSGHPTGILAIVGGLLGSSADPRLPTVPWLSRCCAATFPSCASCDGGPTIWARVLLDRWAAEMLLDSFLDSTMQETM